MENEERKTTAIITSNFVKGYEEDGLYEGEYGPVEITCCNGCWETKLPKRLSMLLNSTYYFGTSYGKIYLYLSRDAMSETYSLTKALKARGLDLEFVTCNCSAGIEARQIARDFDAQIIPAECGGFRTLREIVDRLLGRVPIPGRNIQGL